MSSITMVLDLICPCDVSGSIEARIRLQFRMSLPNFFLEHPAIWLCMFIYSAQQHFLASLYCGFNVTMALSAHVLEAIRAVPIVTMLRAIITAHAAISGPLILLPARIAT